MIKGPNLKEKETIQKPNVNYRALSALNVSMIKLFEADPVRFFEQFKLGRKRKDKKTVSLTIGDLIDFYLLDCKGNDEEFEVRFDEKFALMETNKGTGQAIVLADILFAITKDDTDDKGEITTEFSTRFSEAYRRAQEMGKYSGKTEDKALEDFNEKGYEYFKTLMENLGKNVVDISLVDKAKRVAKGLMFDEFTAEIFADSDEDIEYFTKFPIEWIYKIDGKKEIACKSELDIIKIDHANKVIYPMDLKTTYDNEEFEYGYLKYRYDLQAAFYFKAVKFWAEMNEMGEYRIDPMEFVVADTSANNRRPIRYKTSYNDLEMSRGGFMIRGKEYKGLEVLISEISWAEDNNIWNCSKELVENKGVMNMKLKYE